MRSKQQRMAVLGLLSIGLRYGWQMEKFAVETDMRQWTPIGMSTIYKVLKDLAREGLVIAQKEPGGKGAARVSYALTQKGREAFQTEVTAALRSNASVFSDRIAGLVFLPALKGPAAQEGDERLRCLVERGGHRVGQAIGPAPGRPHRRRRHRILPRRLRG